MSDTPVVILVHGMGKHLPGEITKDFVSSINSNLNQISGHEAENIDDLVKIVEINYDGFFDKVRKKMAEKAKPVADRLEAIRKITGLVSWGADLVQKITSLESKYNDDKFFYTHWLDVIFYTTLLGAKVRVDVAKKIAETIRDNAPQNKIHIVAHSLGTSVVHDTLSQLFRGDFIANDDIPDLDLVTHRLKSVWMVANVSRLVNGFTDISDPYRSTVRPSPEGCMDYFRNVRHELDPFTRICQFDPKNDSNWVSRDFFESGYKNIETSAITKMNTHDFAEYIKNPKVSLPLLRQILRIIPEKQNSDEIFDSFRGASLVGAFDELKESFKDIKITDTGSLNSFLTIGKEFSKTVEKSRD